MKKIKVLILLAISAVLTNNVSASTIDKIEAIDNNTIELTASSDVLFSDINVEGDIKLLKDIAVSFSTKDPEDFQKVILNLSTDLTANTSYSLITILGANGNIDFVIDDFLEGEIINTNLAEGDEGIVKINIIDSRTIELYFDSDLNEDVFEFKILSDIIVDSLESIGNNILQLNVFKNLEKDTSYVIMILSLDDASGNFILLDEDLYEMKTPIDLIEKVNEEELVVAEVKEEVIIEEEGNIEEVALNSAETPETGTATGVLVMLAIILNIGFFFRKKLLNK